MGGLQHRSPMDEFNNQTSGFCCKPKIIEGATVDEWFQVKSNDNAADTGTRGIAAGVLWDSDWVNSPYILQSVN